MLAASKKTRSQKQEGKEWQTSQMLAIWLYCQGVSCAAIVLTRLVFDACVTPEFWQSIQVAAGDSSPLKAWSSRHMCCGAVLFLGQAQM